MGGFFGCEDGGARFFSVLGARTLGAVFDGRRAEDGALAAGAADEAALDAASGGAVVTAGATFALAKVGLALIELGAGVATGARLQSATAVAPAAVASTSPSVAKLVRR